MKTLYRPVPGFIDLYASIDGTVVKSGRGELAQKVYKGSRYPLVHIPGLNGRHTYPVHALVAAAFFGERPKGIVTRHGPAGELDNSVGNLCYGTQKDNQGDSIACGTHQSVANAMKTRCKRGHRFSPENTYVAPGKTYRTCRTCAKDLHHARYIERTRGVAAK